MSAAFFSFDVIASGGRTGTAKVTVNPDGSYGLFELLNPEGNPS